MLKRIKPNPNPRFQCRHIFTDGRRCASPCLRHEEFCYFHHTSRQPIPKSELKARKARRSTFPLASVEDRSAIQHAIGQVLARIAANDLDPRRAGLLLYGLQIASLNLPKAPKSSKKSEEAPPELVEDLIEDPILGKLAPKTELPENLSFLEHLHESIHHPEDYVEVENENENEDEDEQPCRRPIDLSPAEQEATRLRATQQTAHEAVPNSFVLPAIQAVAAPPRHHPTPRRSKANSPVSNILRNSTRRGRLCRPGSVRRVAARAGSRKRCAISTGPQPKPFHQCLHQAP